MKVECKKVILIGMVFSDFVTSMVSEAKFRGNHDIYVGRVLSCDTF